MFSLSDAEAARGVATHSSGNHAQALALAARLRGIPAHIVMPENSPAVKVEAVRGYGGRIVFCEPTQAAREEALAAVVAETGACFVHPYDDPRVIAGPGHVRARAARAGRARSTRSSCPSAAAGSRAARCSRAASPRPATAVYAVEPKGADDAFRSVRDGRIHPSTDPRTIADGLRTSLGTLTFPIVKALVRAGRHRGGRVDRRGHAPRVGAHEARDRAVRGGPPRGPAGRRGGLTGKRVGIILSGGNVDLGSLPWSR